MTIRIVIIGASLAGVSAAAALHEKGFAGVVTVIGDEVHVPYNRPPLSKDVILGLYGANETDLPRPRADDNFEIEWHLGVAVTRLDTQAKLLFLADGIKLHYDKLLIATGTRARPWPDAEEAKLTGLSTLRSRDDAVKIARDLDAQPDRVVIIGGGFMGSELAASCRQRGLAVTLIDRGPAPMANALGATVAMNAAALQRRHGVDLRCNSSVKKVLGDKSGRVCAVELDDGSLLQTNLIVAALGAVPNTEWLHGSGVDAGAEGVLCNSNCRVFTTDSKILDDVYVAGDVARFVHPAADDGWLRLEHWDNAIQMARIAVHNMLCEPADEQAHSPIPAFWSTQYEINIKSLGFLESADQVILTEGSFSDSAFTAVYGKDGKVVGVVAFNGGRTLPSYERLIVQQSPFPPNMTTNNQEETPDVMPAGFKSKLMTSKKQ